MKTWSYSVGDRGCSVRVYERTPGGVLYISASDPTLQDGKGGYGRVSLGYRDRKRAKKQARALVKELEAGETSASNPTLGYVVDLYRHDHVSILKTKTVTWLTTCLDCWVNYLGRSFKVYDIGPREWEAFKAHRSSGAIDARGNTVEPDKRRQIRPGTVNLGLEALTMCFNWATMWRVNKRPVLDRSPVHKLPFLDDANRQRSVWTYDRFLKMLAAAEGLEMEVGWSGKREKVASHLADVLVIAEGTGRRIGAVRQLRYADLLLDQGQHGKVRWRADTDKTRKEWITPISPEVRARLLKVVRARPGLGDAPLFPAPRDPRRPIDHATLRRHLRLAEKAAGVERLPHDSFHGLRRKFVTERKHLPDVDVAHAAGWRSINTMRRSYQRADEAGVLEAILEPRRLRDREA